MTQKAKSYETDVINDPLGQTHGLAVVFAWNWPVLLDFEKWGRTYGQHVRKQLSLPAVTVGWPSGSKILYRVIFQKTKDTKRHFSWILLLTKSHFETRVFFFSVSAYLWLLSQSIKYEFWLFRSLSICQVSRLFLFLKIGPKGSAIFW